jgi:outer membrane immunogenic protein
VKRTVLGLVSVLALAVSAPVDAANAADMAVKAPPPPMAPAPAYFNWTGFYIGANVGGGWANSSVSGSTLFDETGGTPISSTFAGSYGAGGVLGGGQIGANYEFPSHWVIGLEADIDGSNLSGSGGNCSTTALGVGVGCTGLSTKFNDFGTVRGRLGYAGDNLLLYGTGGWAWGQSTTNSNFTCVGVGTCPGPGVPFTGGGSSVSTTATNGWAAGAGLEYAFARNWTIRAEYLHIQFNGTGETLATSGTVTALAVPYTATINGTATVNMDIGRVGLNYLFH